MVEVRTARINVEVDGVEQLNDLASAFERIRAGAGAAPQATQAAGRTTTQSTQAATTAGEQVGERIGYVLGQSIRAPFDLIRGHATAAASSMVSFLGPLAQMGVRIVAATPSIAAAGVAAAAVAVPLFNLAVTIKLLRSSFGWAEDQAEEQLKLIARTKRTFPGLVGEGFARAEEGIKTKFNAAAALFGEQAVDSMETRLTRQFTEYRMGKGLRGEKDIFARWGITPEFVQQYEQQTGERMNLTNWLAHFIQQREKIEAEIRAAPEGSAEQQEAIRRRAAIADDSLKLFNQKFSDVIMTWSSVDVARLMEGMTRAAPLGALPEGADQNARDFTVALRSVQNTFQQLKNGIAGDMMPIFATMMDDINNWMLPIQSGGQGLGTALRDLASALSIHAWETMRSLIADIDTESVTSLVDSFKGWDPSSTVQALTQVVPFITTVAGIVQKIAEFVGYLNKTPGELLNMMLGRGGGAPEGAQAFWGDRGAWGTAAGAPAGGAGAWGGGGAAGAAMLPPEVGAGPGYRGGAGTTFRPGVRASTNYLGDTPGGAAGIVAGGGNSAGAGATGAWTIPPQGAGTLAAGARVTHTRAGMTRDEFNTGPLFGPAGPSNQTTIRLKDGQRLTVNKNVAARYEGFLNEMIDRGYPVRVNGGYNYRSKVGGSGLSMHAYGTAVDINVPQNPYQPGRRGGVRTDMPEDVEQLAWKHGLSWGARFGDPMHFEAMGPQALAKTQEILRSQGLPTQPTTPSPMPAAANAPIGMTAAPTGPIQAGRVIPAHMQTPEVMNALREVGAKHNIDPMAIAGVITTESAWKTGAVTGRYRGLTQIGPENPEWANIGRMAPADQIRTYGRWLDRYNFGQKLQNANIDFSRLTAAQQAAYLQGFQFAPNATSWQLAAGQGRGDVRTTATKQARVLGTTTLNEMTRYYEGLMGAQQAAGARPAANTPTTTDLVQPAPGEQAVRLPDGNVVIMPTTGRVTSAMGTRRHPITGRISGHAGVDIGGGNYGQSIVTTGGGTVIRAGKAGGYGNFVEIRRDDGTTERYGHMAQLPAVQVGQKVERGQQIGIVGSTGMSTGPHLHYERRDAQGRPIDINREIGAVGTRIAGGVQRITVQPPLEVAAKGVEPAPETEEEAERLRAGAPRPDVTARNRDLLTRKSTEDASEERAARRDADRKALEEKPRSKEDEAIKQGSAAGKAAADKFKEEVKDVKIPVKLPSDGDKERDKEPEPEKKAA